MLAGVTPTAGAGGHVKLEAVDDLTAVGGCPGGAATPSPLLSPLEIKTEKVSDLYGAIKVIYYMCNAFP